MANPGTCKTCKFSNLNPEGQLFCHKRGPQVTALPQQSVNPITRQPHLNIRTFGFWPPVDPNEGCWEWEAQLVMP